MSKQHEDMMRHALKLAARAEGCTTPNPMVGAVLVRDGRIIGEGWHQHAGGPHAEVVCLNSASESPAGATMYVSLEPCCHYGKTPPCTKALIDAGVAEVFYAVPDFNPRVSGGGHRQLEEAGLKVYRGPLEQEGRFLNRAFFTYITEKRAHVTAKYAMTLDGRIATVTGESQWITGPEARHRAHRLRHYCDAVIVGADTVIADNPRLTTRLEGDVNPSHPLRIVLDSRGRVPLDMKIFSRELPGKSLVATTEAMPVAHKGALEQQDIEVLVLPSDHQKRPDVGHLLRQLAQRDLVRVMVEGGGHVLGSFLDAGYIDETWTFLGGKVVGGQQAPGPFAGKGIPGIADALDLQIYETLQCGHDFLIKAVRQ